MGSDGVLILIFGYGFWVGYDFLLWIYNGVDFDWLDFGWILDFAWLLWILDSDWLVWVGVVVVWWWRGGGDCGGLCLVVMGHCGSVIVMFFFAHCVGLI